MGGVGPRRGLQLNLPPTEGVQGVLDQNCKVMANSASPSFFLYLLHLKASDPSLFLSPGAWGPPESRPRFASSTFLGPLVLIFCSSETLFKIYIEKITKQMRKSRILASQNPPKTFPKCLQNRNPKKHAIFHRFLFNFVFCCNRQHQKFIGPANALSAFHTIWLFAFGIRFGSKKPTKNLSKTTSEPFQNQCQKHVVF